MDFVFCIWDKLANSITIDGITKAFELGLAFWGCFIAAKGLSTWREQIIEQPRIELAREIMEQFYNIRDLIERARCIMISFSPEEVKKYYSMKNLSNQQCGYLYRKFILDTNFEIIDKFQKLRNKAITLYSNDIDECFMGIIFIVNKIRNAAKELSDDDVLEDKSYSKSLRKILCQHENDDMSIKLNNIIKEVETNLKPIYAPKTITWKHFNKETNND